MQTRIFSTCTCIVMLYVALLDGQQGMSYREFQLGSDLSTVAALTGVAATKATLIHRRPALMQDLEWRPRYSARGRTSFTDPVEVILFKFYDNQLFSIVVDYDRTRTEGMSDADMVEAISAVYGPSLKVLPTRPRASKVQYGTPDTAVAVWGDEKYSVTLWRVAYPATFKLVVASTHLDALARTSAAEAARLDTREAPQREIERQKKEAADAMAARDKAKTENKAGFRP